MNKALWQLNKDIVFIYTRQAKISKNFYFLKSRDGLKGI